MKERGLRSSWVAPAGAGGAHVNTTKEAPVSRYDGRQFVGIDLHRNRSVIVRQDEAGQRLGMVRISSDPIRLAAEIARAGPAPEVVLEATYGWVRREGA